MAASLARSTANRALHLRITPRPSTLGESREILRLLSGFGEIEYFKNLKYDTLTHPNIALVIFNEEEAARNCHQKGPIRFRMGKAPAGDEGIYSNETAIDHGNTAPEPPPVAPPPPSQASSHSRASRAPFGLTQSRSTSTASYQPSIPNPPPRAPVQPFERPKPTMLEPRLFQIQTNSARTNFRDQINMGPYYGNFPMDSKSVAQRDLVKSVPAPAMSCVNWRAEPRPWRIVQKEKEEGGKVKTLWELHKEGLEGAATFRNESLPGGGGGKNAF